eukprot:scaffold49877_cov66-Phaeocystis_antarctica.AAC.1
MRRREEPRRRRRRRRLRVVVSLRARRAAGRARAAHARRVARVRRVHAGGPIGRGAGEAEESQLVVRLPAEGRGRWSHLVRE